MVQPQKASPELRDARILVIDDEAQNVRSLTRLLTWAGYTTIRGVTESADAVRTFVEWEPDLLLLDLRMPGMDGFEVMEALSPLVPDGEYLPILVLTGDLDDTSRNRALTAGARDFLTKPFETTEVLLRIENLLETRHLHQRLRRQNVHLEHKVQERTRELADAQVEILYRLALAAEYRDDVTGQHAERVGVLSGMIAGVMDFAENDVDLIRRAAPLHDVGKIGVPDAILMKPGRLTEDELEVIRSHVDIGAQILSGGGFPLLRVAREIAASHHEQWSGRGYKGMVGEEIPIVGRIVAVADVYDVVTNERPYKAALSHGEAVRRIVVDRGQHFDPAVVDAFLEVVDRGLITKVGEMANRPGFLDLHEAEPAWPVALAH